MQGALIDYKAGTVIFKEGDPGGDLYFIKAGDVQVFREKDGHEVVLATLKTGEVLGIMTCLTRDPRLASARALNDVKVLSVRQAGIKTLISSTPQWVNAVIKDFIVRIKNMDELYMKAVSPATRGGAERPLGLAVTLARGLIAFGEALATGAGAARSLALDDFLMRLAAVRDVPKDKLDAVAHQLADAGLIAVEGKGPARKLPVVELGALRAFLDLVLVWHDEPILRERWLSVDDTEATALTTMVEVAKYHGAKPGTEYESPLLKLRGESHPLDLARRALAKAEDLGFAKVAGNGDDAKVMLKAVALQHALRSLAAIRALSRAPLPAAAAPAKNPEETAKVLAENF